MFEHQHLQHGSGGQDQHILRRQIAPLFERMADPDQRKNLPPVLRHPLISGAFDLGPGNVFQTSQQVERCGNQWVTQYRGQILPLIRISHALEERRYLPADDVLTLPTTAMLQVLVLEHEHHSFGLVVNEILDIVESTLEPQSPATRAGVLHSSVIADRVTELLDVPALLRAGEAYEPVLADVSRS